MADEPIYYMFSCRVPCLGEKLEQRDRLIDSQVYLKVLSRREIRVTIQHSEHPCSSATLLLASLLRPHIHRFPLQFDFNTNNTPRAFYTFDFASRRLPPPSGISFGFNVLFALPIESKSTLAVQLAQVIFCVSEGVRSVSTGMKLWDLTFRVDRNHVFGALQFETRDRHEKIQMEGHFYASSRISTDRTTHEVTFYREMSGSPLPDRVVSTYMRQISKTLRELTESGHIYEWQSLEAVM